MLASTNPSMSRGFSLVEVLVIVTLIGLLLVPIVGAMFVFYGNTVGANRETQLALDSQTILRSVSDELRVSAGVRDSNAIDGPNKAAGGWNTSNDNLVLIIATPALDSSNDYIINSTTGEPYYNEFIYYAVDSVLYKRTLAHPSATDNQATTSCTVNTASPSCSASYPDDKILTEDFKDMTFTFYDQDNQVTTTLSEARSIDLSISMEQRIFGRTISQSNDMRVTLRNKL